MNGKQLKNSILQWAIQGKLVPQDHNDEPASVLLEKIRQEKEHLIKEKKIKRDKNASIIYRGEDNSYYEKILATGEVKCIDEEIPFEVPQGWEWERFGNVMINKDSERIPLSVAQRQHLKKTYDYYGASGVIDKVDKYLFDKDLLLIGEDGANLINRSTPIAFIAKGKYWVNNHAHVLDVCSGMALSYVALFINAISLVDYVTGTAQPKMNQEKMNSILLAIPPVKEQHRILEKMSKVDAFVEKYASLQTKLDSLDNSVYELLRKSIIQEAIQGKLVPQIAKEGTAQELLEQIKVEKEKLVKEGKLKKSVLNDSVIFRGDDNKYYEQIGSEVTEIELPFDFPSSWSIVRLYAVCQLTDGLKTTGKQCLLDAKYLRGKSSGTIIEQGKLVYKGDNIMLVDGENSGEVFIVPQDGYMGSTFKQLWISSSLYEPYILAFIQFYKETLRNSKKGAAIPHLNKELFYGLIIGIPPFQEQKRIVQKIGLSAQLLK
ncbi:restriction endonuclease subunit S [Segatella hominis]|uniref:restriction endonuclease subunit S n=1 Tax=Segatella hominis TaxID=2518605 RepID=UPI003AB940F0